jgi:hypothetical protein
MSPSRLPQSSKESFKIIRGILSMGELDIPAEFRGTGAPGDYLEFLCNIKRNNYDSPDLKDWEVKFNGGKSLVTLLHKDPEPKNIVDKLVDTFGWDAKDGQIGFRHTISGHSKRGFVVNDTNKTITVTNEKDKSIVPFWKHDTILNAGGGKIRRLILVSGKYDSKTRKVVYENATAYWDLKLTDFFQSMVEGMIKIDFDARTNNGRGSSIRNHGTKFRIKKKDIEKIYDSQQLIV